MKIISKDFAKNLFVRVIEKGIKIWITNKCNSIKEINLNISANNFDLIRGNLKKVTLSAIDVNFKHLLFREINLETNSINFSIGTSSKLFTFTDNFSINSKIKISEEQLNTTLKSKEWSWVMQIIQDKLLYSNKVSCLKICNKFIQINFTDKKDEIKKTNNMSLKAINGGINIKNIENSNNFNLPIEDSIHIKEIQLNKDELKLELNAEILI